VTNPETGPKSGRVAGNDRSGSGPSASAATTPSAIEDLVRWRRDVRRFRRDPVPDALIDQLLRVADLAPSVGNSQPWRVLNVTRPETRQAMCANFKAANAEAAASYTGEQAAQYATLKLAGFDAAPVHLAVFSDHSSLQGSGLGRQTMPETLDHSCACMITILWLAAREAGLGMGWVSILDPVAAAETLNAEPGWSLIGYLLLGWPEEEHLDPELERFGWQARSPFESRVSTDAATPSAKKAERKANPKVGSVTLVGAGPGDPDLLTVRAVRVLASADVVLFDDLVAEPVLDLINATAERINVGKRGYRASCKQPDINTQIVELARQGRHVVRLKSGDPLIFGRAGEEIQACRDAGIAVSVVPGVTSAQGAAASLGVSLTHRNHARRLQFITAHDRHGRLPPDIDWSAVADATATTVVYMPKHTLVELANVAMAHGLDAATPALAVANATRPDEQVLVSTIGAIGRDLNADAISGPVLILIGEALRDAVKPCARVDTVKTTAGTDV
jgi:uroporphyrin-III C-methyltransferase / precorrin-2 dehydrogenase / sirohydrochlorin ferrochelatase